MQFPWKVSDIKGNRAISLNVITDFAIFKQSSHIHPHVCQLFIIPFFQQNIWSSSFLKHSSVKCQTSLLLHYKDIIRFQTQTLACNQICRLLFAQIFLLNQTISFLVQFVSKMVLHAQWNLIKMNYNACF